METVCSNGTDVSSNGMDVSTLSLTLRRLEVNNILEPLVQSHFAP